MSWYVSAAALWIASGCTSCLTDLSGSLCDDAGAARRATSAAGGAARRGSGAACDAGPHSATPPTRARTPAPSAVVACVLLGDAMRRRLPGSGCVGTRQRHASELRWGLQGRVASLRLRPGVLLGSMPQPALCFEPHGVRRHESNLRRLDGLLCGLRVYVRQQEMRPGDSWPITSTRWNAASPTNARRAGPAISEQVATVACAAAAFALDHRTAAGR